MGGVGSHVADVDGLCGSRFWSGRPLGGCAACMAVSAPPGSLWHAHTQPWCRLHGLPKPAGPATPGPRTTRHPAELSVPNSPSDRALSPRPSPPPAHPSCSVYGPVAACCRRRRQDPHTRAGHSCSSTNRHLLRGASANSSKAAHEASGQRRGRPLEARPCRCFRWVSVEHSTALQQGP